MLARLERAWALAVLRASSADEQVARRRLEDTTVPARRRAKELRILYRELESEVCRAIVEGNCVVDFFSPSLASFGVVWCFFGHHLVVVWTSPHRRHSSHPTSTILQLLAAESIPDAFALAEELGAAVDQDAVLQACAWGSARLFKVCCVYYT